LGLPKPPFVDHSLLLPIVSANNLNPRHLTQQSKRTNQRREW
jgi:hypothetical protein